MLIAARSVVAEVAPMVTVSPVARIVATVPNPLRVWAASCAAGAAGDERLMQDTIWADWPVSTLAHARALATCLR